MLVNASLWVTVLTMISLLPSSASCQEEKAAARHFRMGFTGFPHDFSIEAVVDARQFSRQNADIIAHHIEGVPWAELLADKPFSDELINEWKGKKEATPEGGKVYLAISPGRGDLKPGEKSLPFPKELVGKSYDDPVVMKAYLGYCRRMVTERQVGDARCLRLGQRRPHAVFVDLVRAGVRQHHGDQRQPRRSRLGFDQFPPHGVHRHPVERLVERGQEADDFEVGLLAQDVKRSGDILAGTPGEQDFAADRGYGRIGVSDSLGMDRDVPPAPLSLQPCRPDERRTHLPRVVGGDRVDPKLPGPPVNQFQRVGASGHHVVLRFDQEVTGPRGIRPSLR